MDDDLQQLEAELKRLRPAAPTRTLLARLDRELAAPTAAIPVRRATPLWWFWAGALPSAAAFALMIALASRHQPPTIAVASPSTAVDAPVAFKPVAAENVLYAAQDEGLVTLDDGTTARRERLNYLDTITWKNPRTNASVRWTVPREEVRVVPVKFQ